MRCGLKVLASVWLGSALLSFPYLLAVHATPVPGSPYDKPEFKVGPSPPPHPSFSVALSIGKSLRLACLR